MRRSLRVAWLVQAGLLLSWHVAAQVKLGDTSTNLNGTISTGYTADFGNQTSSDHNWTIGGNTNLSGFFYSPNFLSYNANIYLNQSRANSDFQSISSASGVSVGANIFGGSNFPGSIGYTKAYDSEGSYAVPGIANYVTHGNNDAFGVNWNENLPNVPSFSAGFQMGSSQYSVYGTNDEGKNSFHSLNLHSSYRLAGFNMGAYFSSGGGHSLIPEAVSGQENSETHSDNSAYGFNVSHRLPMHGSWVVAVNRSNFADEYAGISTSGTIDLVNMIAAVHPTGKLYLSVSADYSDNLSGQLIQSVVAAGGAVPGLNSNESSDSVDLMAVAGYSMQRNLQATAYVERRNQSYLGESYGETSYGGSANYSRSTPYGNFNAALNVTANTSDQTGEDTLGFSTTENYSGEIRGWKVNGSFGYAQNVQTLLVTDMNSFYNYSGNANRRWGKLNVSMGAGASRTALTQQAGTANSSQSYSAGVGYTPWITASGSYFRATGQALATGSGLVPVTGPLPPSSLVTLYGGDGYSFSLSSAPAKGLTVGVSYAKSTSNTSAGGIPSLNETDEYNALIQYQVRKLNVISGYSRLGQGFGGSGSPPQIVSSFYIGVSRWFNFF